MKVIVTGGAGFIGSNTVDLLIDKGHNVIIVDNLSTGKKENLNPKAKFYEIDIRDEKLGKLFENEKPDAVIHLAAQANARKSIVEPFFDSDINIAGSLKILELCKTFNVKKIVYSSSAAVYGEPQDLPLNEKHPIKPTSPYGISKYTPELYFHLSNLDYVILRYSNVYGPRQDPHGEAGVIAIFYDKIKNQQSITINGDGKQTRDFIFVKDVAKANLLALEKNSPNKVFNISTNTPTSIIDLAKMFASVLNKEVDIKYKKAIEGEIRDSSLDNSLAKKELGFEHKFDLKDGLIDYKQ